MEDFIQFVIEELPAKKKRGRPRKEKMTGSGEFVDWIQGKGLPYWIALRILVLLNDAFNKAIAKVKGTPTEATARDIIGEALTRWTGIGSGEPTRKYLMPIIRLILNPSELVAILSNPRSTTEAFGESIKEMLVKIYNFPSKTTDFLKKIVMKALAYINPSTGQVSPITEFEDILDEVIADSQASRMEQGEMEGNGWIGDKLRAVKKAAQGAVRKVGSVVLGKQRAEKIERYGDAVLFLSNLPLPPSVKEYLRKYGEERISKIVIVRNAVQKLLTGAMNAVSLGSFSKKFSRLPYDDLFHLQLWVTTPSGVFGIEKNEVITFTQNPTPKSNAESQDVALKPDLTMNKLMTGSEKIQGSNFTRYDAYNNNCQDFVMSLLKGSGLGNETNYQFVKQDTDSLFKNDSFLRKFSRNLTNIGASVSTAFSGVDDKPIASTKTSDTFEIPSPQDTDILEAGGRQRKLPKKAEKGQRTIPEITAAQEAEAIRLAAQLRNPSVMARVHDLLARQARGELDANFNVIQIPTEPNSPEGSQGAGMVKRGRGRPRKVRF
jgi:hypothetical protein